MDSNEILLILPAPPAQWNAFAVLFHRGEMFYPISLGLTCPPYKTLAGGSVDKTSLVVAASKIYTVLTIYLFLPMIYSIYDLFSFCLLSPLARHSPKGEDGCILSPISFFLTSFHHSAISNPVNPDNLPAVQDFGRRVCG